ncbi:MAG: DUF1441 family protein [Pseudoruegeria sp.]
MTDRDQTSDLLPSEVSENLAGWLREYPMPAGVPDADMNQEELGLALDVSVNTIGKWVREGMPVVQEGGAGKAYVLRLSHCFAWKKARDEAETARSKHNRQAIEKMQASFLGLDVDDSGVQLTAKQRKELADADFAHSRAAKARRTLVPLQEVVDLLESVLKATRDSMEILPDRLERELGLEAEQIEIVKRIGADVLNNMHDQIEQAELAERSIADADLDTRLLV